MKKLLLVLSIAVMAFSACGTTGSPKSESDSLAYAMGVKLGEYFAQMDTFTNAKLNINVVFAAMKDAVKGKTKMSSEAADNFMREYFTVRIPQKNRVASEEFLAQVEKSNKNVQKTTSGILYEITQEGTGVKSTNIADRVRVIYRGTLRTGKEFDSSAKHGDTVEFALNQVIPGWTEGLQLVNTGGKIKLWIPSDLAYGEYGQGMMIGPNEALVFEVELIEIIPAAVPETEEPK